jgi:hypothetical protein
LEKMEMSHLDHELNDNSLIIQPITYWAAQVTTMFYSAIRYGENLSCWQTLQTVVYHSEFTGFEPSGMWHCTMWLVFWRNSVPSSKRGCGVQLKRHTYSPVL